MTPHALTRRSPAELLLGLCVDKKRSARVSSFETGDWVRIKRPQVGHKLRSQRSAPIQIRKKISNDSYLLSERSKWYANNLVRTKAPPSLSSKLADLEHILLGPLLKEGDQSFGIAGEGERNEQGRLKELQEQRNEQDSLEELKEQAPRRSTRLRHRPSYHRDFVYQYAT